MPKAGKRFLLGCGLLGAGTVLWVAWQWYKWSVIDWDRQDGGM